MSSVPEDPPPNPASSTTQPTEKIDMGPVTAPLFNEENKPNGSQRSPVDGIRDATVEADLEIESSTNGLPSLDDHPVVTAGESAQKKKKRKKRKKAVGSMATGFEEFYADAPTTPEEAQEEQMTYSPRRRFEDRIEECLNRFRSRRRMDNQLIRYFNEYLFLGGIDTSQNAFQGVDQKTYAEASTEEKQQLANVYGIFRAGENPKFYSPSMPEHWTVDFSAVVAGYLSEGVPHLTWHMKNADNEIQRAIGVVANFLRYLLQHDVCNEYKDDITNALGLCNKAKEDLPRMFKAMSKVPCRFNDAASNVFKDGKQFEYVQEHLRKEPLTIDEEIFSLGVVFFGPSNVFHRLKSLKVVQAVGNEEPCSLEILSTSPIDETARQTGKFYGKMCNIGDSIQAGIIRCKHILIRDEFSHGETMEDIPDTIEELVIEEELLKLLRPGDIIRVSLAELNIGLKYMANLPRILPIFYRFLPQSLMRHYKPPRPNERPAPSALDTAGGEDGEIED